MNIIISMIIIFISLLNNRRKKSKQEKAPIQLLGKRPSCYFLLMVKFIVLVALEMAPPSFSKIVALLFSDGSI